MEPNRFDVISRTLATRFSRRRLGIAGMLGGLGLALHPRDGSGQAEQGRTCEFDLFATVAAGPHAGQIFSGALTLPMGPDGAIDAGSFTSDAGPPATVRGQATDRILRLRIDLGSEGVLALGGVAGRRIAGCRGELNGVFGGPATSDLGTWQAVRQSAGSSSQTATATTNAVATRTPCLPVDCGQTFVQNPDTCECDCPEPYDRCGGFCCPGGSTCLDPANGECQCPQGAEICNEVCTAPCPQGQTLDYATCICGAGCAPVQCPAGQTQDTLTCQCVPQTNGCPPGDIECSGFCTTITSNPQNCGSCGNICPAGVPCIGGSCQCPFGYTQCPAGCVDTQGNDRSNCGSCGNVCPERIFCSQGVCCNPSGIFAQCLFNTDCCSGSCYFDAISNATYCL